MKFLLFNNISFLDKVLFTKHLAVMLKSGIPLAEAIESIKDQSRNPNFAKIIDGILVDVENGQTLERAMSKYPSVFDSFSRSLIKIGEESGNLEENLEYLALQLRKSYEFRKKIQGALFYPILVLSAVFIVGFSLSIFVLPKLVDLFNSLNTTLPVSTKILLWIAGVMKDYGVFIFGGVIILGLVFNLIINTSVFKPKWHSFLLSVPVFGILLQNIELSSMCRNLGIMLKSGLPIVQALQTQTEGTANLVYKKYLEEFTKTVEKGKDLSAEMNLPKYRFVPKIFSKMINVGEKSGKLEDVLLYLGDFFEDEVDDTAKNLSNILEPVLLLIIGAVVAFVALAIISPIYELTGAIHK